MSIENPRFRESPVKQEIPLHFTPDEQQLQDWLTSLAAFEHSRAAEKLLETIKGIEAIEIKTSLKIKLLNKILQYLPGLVQELQKSYLDESLPLPEQANKNVELVVWSYLQLAKAFRQCKLKYTALGKEQHALLLYLSLHALSRALVHIALSYKMPMHGFWSLCYDLYARAEQANLTKVIIHFDRQQSANIGQLFKQMLIFHVCDTQQFRGRDILMLFDSFETYAPKAKILANYQPKWQPVVCVFNLNKDIPPQKVNPEDSRDDLSERFITTVAVAKNIFTSLQDQSVGTNALRSINREALLRALNSLGLARKRKFTRIAEHNEFEGIIGLTPLINYIQTKQDVVPPQPLSTKASFGSSPAQTSAFELVPVGDELAHQMRETHKQELKKNTQLNKIFSIADAQPHASNSQSSPADHAATRHADLCMFSVLDSSAKGYGLMAKLPTTQVKVGDIIAVLAQSNDRIEIGLVRRINQMANQHLRLGVEMIGFESKLVYVTLPNTSNSGLWAILLPGIKSLNQADSLLFNSSLIKQGDAIEIRNYEQRARYRLHRTLQITSAATHIELAKLADA